jgi:hypothetical protein
VVNGVSASPEVVRREREHTDHTSDPVVCETMMEESAMTAIVLNHKQPHEKARSRHREQQADPVAKIKGCPHQKPEQNKRSGGDDELNNAGRRARCAIAGEDLCPAAGLGGVWAETSVLILRHYLCTNVPIYLNGPGFSVGVGSPGYASQVADAATNAARKTASSFEKALRDTIENQPYTTFLKPSAKLQLSRGGHLMPAASFVTR